MAYSAARRPALRASGTNQPTTQPANQSTANVLVKRGRAATVTAVPSAATVVVDVIAVQIAIPRLCATNSVLQSTAQPYQQTDTQTPVSTKKHYARVVPMLGNTTSVEPKRINTRTYAVLSLIHI